METAIPELNSAGLRRFALTSAGLLAGLFGALLPLLRGGDVPLWPWVSAGILLLWGVCSPATLRPVYRVWIGIALFLGRVNSVLILSIVFILIISPAGIIMRLFGYDPLQRRFAVNARSYRKQSAVRSQDHMEKPY